MEEEKEILEMIDNCRLSKREKEEMKKYIKTKEYPKNNTDHCRFYSAYSKIRNITRLGNKLIELNLIKK